MTSQKKRVKATHRRYVPGFKAEALGLAEQVGVSGTAKQLGLHESQLYTWRKKARYEASRSETEKELAIENARLKRQVAKQAEELAILKRAAGRPGLAIAWRQTTFYPSVNLSPPKRFLSKDRKRFSRTGVTK